MLRLALKGAGFTDVIAEERGDNGLKIVLRERPALVILDLMLPGMDGLAVTNLIQNAIRYSGSKEIEVKLESAPDGKAVISVCDHGVGIPPDCLPRLFGRFYRVDKDRSRALGGTGLGLAIVKHIAQLHGGEASVRSTPGKGSVFTISF